jgi:hypothetical protein
LSDAFYRLSAYGLICEQDGGYTLSPDAQQMMAGQRRKAEMPERVFGIKENLADYHLNGEHTAIQVTEEQLVAAVKEHLASKKTSGRSLLVPKPKPAEDDRKRPGQYKSFATRRRKE